jgi:hypothetical protein
VLQNETRRKPLASVPNATPGTVMNAFCRNFSADFKSSPNLAHINHRIKRSFGRSSAQIDFFLKNINQKFAASFVNLARFGFRIFSFFGPAEQRGFLRNGRSANRQKSVQSQRGFNDIGLRARHPTQPPAGHTQRF